MGRLILHLCFLAGALLPVTPAPAPAAPEILLTVGTNQEYPSLNDALAAARQLSRLPGQRIVLSIAPGDYEEMLLIDVPDLTLRNAARQPDIELTDKGVGIGPGAVRITSYYGHGYDYFSQGSDHRWHADTLRQNLERGDLLPGNPTVGSTSGSFWSATVVVDTSGFEAERIIFENSFNQYISRKESRDRVRQWAEGGKGVRPGEYGNTAVQDRAYVERAAAIAFTEAADRAILDGCRVVGRQDSFFGAAGARVFVYGGVMMGAVDYLFGGMTAVFYRSELSMNVSDVDHDRSYLTAAHYPSGRGMLFYECRITSPVPGTETASRYGAKPGFFGRPWRPETSEVVFAHTRVDTSTCPGYEGRSLIEAVGWNDFLGGQSPAMYEYDTREQSGDDHAAARAPWATLLHRPELPGSVPLRPVTFTRGDDGWDPLPRLLATDSHKR